MRQVLIVESENGEKVLEMGMWTPWHRGEKDVAMHQTKNDQAEDKLDYDSETGSGARAHLI